MGNTNFWKDLTMHLFGPNWYLTFEVKLVSGISVAINMELIWLYDSTQWQIHVLKIFLFTVSSSEERFRLRDGGLYSFKLYSFFFKFTFKIILIRIHIDKCAYLKHIKDFFRFSWKMVRLHRNWQYSDLCQWKVIF